MSDDLAERLRTISLGDVTRELLVQAADEIQQLRELVGAASQGKSLAEYRKEAASAGIVMTMVCDMEKLRSYPVFGGPAPR